MTRGSPAPPPALHGAGPNSLCLLLLLLYLVVMIGWMQREEMAQVRGQTVFKGVGLHMLSKDGRCDFGLSSFKPEDIQEMWCEGTCWSIIRAPATGPTQAVASSKGCEG